MTARELLQELVDCQDQPHYNISSDAVEAFSARENRAWKAARAYLSAVPQTEPREIRDMATHRDPYVTGAMLMQRLEWLAEGLDKIRDCEGPVDYSDANVCYDAMREIERLRTLAAAPQERAIPREPWAEKLATALEQACDAIEESEEQGAFEWRRVLVQYRDREWEECATCPTPGTCSAAAMCHSAAVRATPQEERAIPRDSDDGCICKGNWRILVKQYEPLIGRMVRDHDGKEWRFYGLVHSDDDFYYGLCRVGETILASCVGPLEAFYTLIPMYDAAQAQEATK